MCDLRLTVTQGSYLRVKLIQSYHAKGRVRYNAAFVWNVIAYVISDDAMT